MKRWIHANTKITNDDKELVFGYFGSYPVEHYRLCSPGWYGYGGYGSDYSVDYWVLEDGRGCETSPYTGEDEYSNKEEMFSAMNNVKDVMIGQVKELLDDEEISKEEYDELMNIYSNT